MCTWRQLVSSKESRGNGEHFSVVGSLGDGFFPEDGSENVGNWHVDSGAERRSIVVDQY